MRSASVFAGGHEVEAGRIHAVAGLRWCATVLEDVSEVGATSSAAVLGAGQDHLEISAVLDLVVADWRPKARPSGATVVLGVAGEQLFVADDTVVRTVVFVVVVPAGERLLSPGLLGHSVLFGRQSLS